MPFDSRRQRRLSYGGRMGFAIISMRDENTSSENRKPRHDSLLRRERWSDHQNINQSINRVRLTLNDSAGYDRLEFRMAWLTRDSNLADCVPIVSTCESTSCFQFEYHAVSESASLILVYDSRLAYRLPPSSVLFSLRYCAAVLYPSFPIPRFRGIKQ